MSIAPVEISSEPITLVASGSARTKSGAAGDATDIGRSSSGTPPKQEKPVTKDANSSYQLPEDVVELHQDPDIRGQVIIQYLDEAKDVVLQVPSEEELNVERGIAQEFKQEAELRASESASSSGGERG